jgi:hypothetical protein
MVTFKKTDSDEEIDAKLEKSMNEMKITVDFNNREVFEGTFNEFKECMKIVEAKDLILFNFGHCKGRTDKFKELIKSLRKNDVVNLILE